VIPFEKAVTSLVNELRLFVFCSFTTLRLRSAQAYNAHEPWQEKVEVEEKMCGICLFADLHNISLVIKILKPNKTLEAVQKQVRFAPLNKPCLLQ
jgi:hypothetical protein